MYCHMLVTGRFEFYTGLRVFVMQVMLWHM